MTTSNYELDDGQFDQLIHDAADNFDEVTISRGFQYFKQGRVTKLTIPAYRYAEAVVEGTHRYKVSLNLDFFSLSSCSCPVDGYCKHIFAAILKYADTLGRSVAMLVNAKTIASPIVPAKPAPAAYKQTAKTERDAKLREDALRIPTLSVAEWHDWLDRCSEPYRNNLKNAQYARDVLTDVRKIVPDLPVFVQQLLVLHSRWHVLSKLAGTLQEQPSYVNSYVAYQTQDAITEQTQAMQQSIAGMGEQAADPANARWVRMTLDYWRRETLAMHKDAGNLLSLYQSLWTHWIVPGLREGDSRPFEDELRELDRAAQELEDAGKPVSPFRRIAEAGMRFYSADDEEALRLLKDAQPKADLPYETVSPYLNELAERGQWGRLADWLTATGPLLGLRRKSALEAYSRLWDATTDKFPESEDRMWDALRALFPLTRPLYEDKLLSGGHWERWMDYQLSRGIDPLDFRVTDLQPIEKNAPALLLPFYHQAAERYVLLKNRDSYKIAVKLLKRLAKLYKKTKQEERWERFLAAFAERNSRLRALGEELRKGNLLP